MRTFITSFIVTLTLTLLTVTLTGCTETDLGGQDQALTTTHLDVYNRTDLEARAALDSCPKDAVGCTIYTTARKQWEQVEANCDSLATTGECVAEAAIPGVSTTSPLWAHCEQVEPNQAGNTKVCCDLYRHVSTIFPAYGEYGFVCCEETPAGYSVCQISFK